MVEVLMKVLRLGACLGSIREAYLTGSRVSVEGSTREGKIFFLSCRLEDPC